MKGGRGEEGGGGVGGVGGGSWKLLALGSMSRRETITKRKRHHQAKLSQRRRQLGAVQSRYAVVALRGEETKGGVVSQRELPVATVCAERR